MVTNLGKSSKTEYKLFPSLYVHVYLPYQAGRSGEVGVERGTKRSDKKETERKGRKSKRIPLSGGV